MILSSFTVLLLLLIRPWPGDPECHGCPRALDDVLRVPVAEPSRVISVYACQAVADMEKTL